MNKHKKRDIGYNTNSGISKPWKNNIENSCFPNEESVEGGGEGVKWQLASTVEQPELGTRYFSSFATTCYCRASGTDTETLQPSLGSRRDSGLDYLPLHPLNHFLCNPLLGLGRFFLGWIRPWNKTSFISLKDRSLDRKGPVLTHQKIAFGLYCTLQSRSPLPYSRPVSGVSCPCGEFAVWWF